MKKLWSVIISAAMIVSNAGFVLADEANPADTDISISAVTDSDVQLFSSVDGITFEYDYSASTELVRVVKVKYDKTYFTGGINKFNAEIKIPEQYTASVSQSSKLTGFNITDSYKNDTFICSGTSKTNKVPSDGALFTMKITLKENILNPFTISLTGDTYIGDSSGITQYLSNGGMNESKLEIPRNINDGGDSGVDGAVTWEYANEVLQLHGNGTMSDYKQGEAPWFKYADKIKSIEFTEENLQNIGRNAFYGLSNAETVILSSDIRSINDSAFEGCTSLRNIDIPLNSGVGIGNYAFKNCSSLTSLDIPSGVRTIGLGAFEGCISLKTATLPFIGSQVGDSNTKNTFSYIFNGKVPQSLKVVSITNDTAVPESAFEGCSYIERIYLNEGVLTIGSKAFKDCTNLLEFKLPKGITEIGSYTFQNCSSIEVMELSDTITAIGAGAFEGCSKIEKLYIPQVSVINNYTFRNCTSLTEIDIPNSVKTVGENILEGCTSLIDVRVPFTGANAEPDTQEEGIFGYLFGGDNSSVPPSVTKVEITSTDRSAFIPEGAFSGCANLQDIVVYGGRAVLLNAFENCYNLRNLYLPKSVSTIGDGTSNRIMSGCARLETLVVPFVGISRRDANRETSVIGSFFGNDTSASTGTLQYYNEEGDSKLYKIPKTLKNVSVLNQTDIPAGAFSECDFIENVAIVSGATMNNFAFYHCESLKTVSLPKNMIRIGKEAFAECKDLETVNIPNKVKEIGESAFYGASSLKSVIIPDSVTEIAEDVFNGTGLYSESEVSLFAAPELTITCSAGSKAYEYAVEKGINTNIVPAGELDIKEVGASISKLSTGGYMVYVTNTSALTGTVYAALYDNSGKMLSAKSEKVTAGDDDNLGYNLEFSADEVQGAVSAKVFVWGGASGMQPQTTEVINITDMPA